jgi:hypothetical protein
MREQQPENQRQQPFQETRANFGMLIGLCQIISMLLTVFLRRPGTWGTRHAGFQMILSWVFAFVFSPLFFPRHLAWPMLVLWIASTVLLLLHRVVGMQLRLKGYECSSRYTGRSWIGGNEITAKAISEPLLVILLGVLAYAVSDPLAVYLIVSGIALAVATWWQVAADNARVRAAKDARFDAEWLNQRLRLGW